MRELSVEELDKVSGGGKGGKGKGGYGYRGPSGPFGGGINPLFFLLAAGGKGKGLFGGKKGQPDFLTLLLLSGGFGGGGGFGGHGGYGGRK